MSNNLPFKYIEPSIWQIPILVLTTSLVAYAANVAGWNIDPVSFFFIPLVLAILFWEERSYSIIKDYLGFNTKNITEKIIASIVGAATGISVYLVLKYSKISLIPWASLKMTQVPTYAIKLSTFFNMLPILMLFSFIILVSMIISSEKIKLNYILPLILTLVIPFVFIVANPTTVLYMIVGYGEEILCLIFAMIAINWLVSKVGLKYNSFITHATAWIIARASWAVVHALSSYGFVLGAYLSAFVLGLIFTVIGYMFWRAELAIIVLSLLGIGDLLVYITQGLNIALYLGILLFSVAGMLSVDRHLFKDDSLKFKEYIIYGAAMAHAFYDLAFVLFQ